MNNTGTKNVKIMKQTAFWRVKKGGYIPRLKYSVPIFVEIYKMQRLEVSGAVWPLYGMLDIKGLIKWKYLTCNTVTYGTHLHYPWHAITFEKDKHMMHCFTL